MPPPGKREIVRIIWQIECDRRSTEMPFDQNERNYQAQIHQARFVERKRVKEQEKDRKWALICLE